MREPAEPEVGGVADVEGAQEGKPRAWDLVRAHDSVSVLLVHTQRRALVLVRQFRPAVFVSAVCGERQADGVGEEAWANPTAARTAITYELCAGIVDKAGKSLAETAAEEIEEECGYRVPIDRISRVTSFRSGIGTTGSTATLFYAEVTDEDSVGSGGGVGDNERLEVELVGLDELESLMMDESKSKPAAFMFAVSWFLRQKLPKL